MMLDVEQVLVMEKGASGSGSSSSDSVRSSCVAGGVIKILW